MIAAVTSTKARDFLDLADLDRQELRRVLDRAHAIKAGTWKEKPLTGRHIAMLFQKPSHRTRVSFEVGIARLGGTTTTLTEQDVQLGVRESVEDAARVLDRYVDGVVARMRSHEDLLKLARASQKPVINGLTERSHPCQILSDLMTIEEARGALNRQRVVFIGDGNNIVNSLIDATELTGLMLTVVTPPGFEPKVRAHGVTITNELPPLASASVIYTDVWTSMGQEGEREARRQAFAVYQVNQRLMSQAPNAVFMHCLPAHRGEEVTDEVIDGPQSIVFDQAGNRLYAQMALLAELLAA
ncbi:MAG TPA: ornithine carbamoyltransferase [Candidatus Dormibacteraeota bacterium]|nr:ornithine carbamoyltransferase [Candidatus Dormibacteraeota bacterium]